MVLKYPDCKICEALRETFRPSDLSDEQINDYHESKIGWEDFDRRLQDDILTVVIETTSKMDMPHRNYT